jgi:uncharacterized protein YyaL (SSP411 family)
MSEQTNALAVAASAYLRSAMHQPVRWHEWGEEAFAAARREDKPILLDVGAVWCHWCHVMDRESYEDAEVAALINQLFIAVKVDRDERPDVDARYQAAMQAIGGQGGWPLTAFLTAEGWPFYGGTYFPPEDLFGRPGFKRVLQSVAQAYREKRQEAMESGQSVMATIDAEALAGHAGEVQPGIVPQIIAAAKSMFDAEHGGFGTAPKFPHPAVLDLLIDHYVRTGDAESRDLFVVTLDRMARGGVYDQLGGGFHRYSTDERWLVPHFEKMAYDNSELLKNYVHAWQATGISSFADVARGIIHWMDSWLSDREHGGFYASQDADISLNDDGDYFTWTLAEARDVLEEDELAVATLHYDINEIGEMQHNHFKNVLFQRAEVEEIARRLSLAPERVAELLRSAKCRLYDARCRRPTPYVDGTIYTGWNALCISAYLQAARALSLDEPRHFALRSLDRILAQGWSPTGELKHAIAYSGGHVSSQASAGLLDDYAFLTLACLDAYEITADLTYFNFARNIGDALIQRFGDVANGGFFDRDSTASNKLGALAAGQKPFQDSPTPAGNSAAAIALLRLYAYTNHVPYRENARKTLEMFAGIAAQFGIFVATYGIAVLSYSQPHTQIVVVGNDELAERLYLTACSPYLINQSVLHLTDNEVAPQFLPAALAETVPNLPGIREGKSLAAVCTGFTCQPPVDDPLALADQLRQAIGEPASPAA